MVGVIRGVAQVARVLAWGARGRKFKSCHSDLAPALCWRYFCIKFIRLWNITLISEVY